MLSFHEFFYKKILFTSQIYARIWPLFKYVKYNEKRKFKIFKQIFDMFFNNETYWFQANNIFYNFKNHFFKKTFHDVKEIAFVKSCNRVCSLVSFFVKRCKLVHLSTNIFKKCKRVRFLASFFVKRWSFRFLASFFVKRCKSINHSKSFFVKKCTSINFLANICAHNWKRVRFSKSFFVKRCKSIDHLESICAHN